SRSKAASTPLKSKRVVSSRLAWSTALVSSWVSTSETMSKDGMAPFRCGGTGAQGTATPMAGASCIMGVLSPRTAPEPAMHTTAAYAATSATAPLAPWSLDRRDPRPGEVLIDIRYCGICHSDLHTVRGEWGPVDYPLVPGHEIVGHVAAVGEGVVKYRVGDAVGVGCFVDSCRSCAQCAAGEEQYCEQGMVATYGSVDPSTGEVTQGGY